MSVYGYLACRECGVYLWLGKAVWRPDGSIDRFKIGGSEVPPNSEQPFRSKTVWKMLAVHVGHEMRVLLEDQLESVLGDGAREIGGGEEGDISLDEFLRGWEG